MFDVDKKLVEDKTDVLNYFRNRSVEILDESRRQYAETEFKKRASYVNKELVASKKKLLQAVTQLAAADKWTNEEILKAVLTVTYANYVVMLEARNAVWEYEYMAFSRRIGELWEPFCKLCFEYPINQLDYFIPPLFSDVQAQLRQEISDYIAGLNLTDDQRSELLTYYEKVWSLVTSGEIKLELDLHFKSNNQIYNIDFKSGFGSNEKGNTNRLLLVATIYQNLEEDQNCILLVRSAEDSNNNYFQTLKTSNVWEGYCGVEAYGKIETFTGFKIQNWIESNIDWAADLSDETFEQFQSNGLDQYLSW